MHEVLRTEKLVYRHFELPILDGMDVALFQGEILGVAGLNGAGRSALADVLSGLKGHDEGVICVEDQPVDYHSVWEAQQLGIYCIRHMSTLIPELKIADNLCIFSSRRMREWRIKAYRNHRVTRTILDELSIAINADRAVSTLSLAEKHLIEIARAVAAKAKVIILDDIMLSYTEAEYWNLYRLLKRIVSPERALILIDSKLDRLLNIAGRIVVMRNGKNIGVFYEDEFDRIPIQKVLTGMGFVINRVEPALKKSEDLLTAVEISNRHLHHFSFTIKKGEVVGFVDEGYDNCRALIHLLNGGALVDAGRIFLEGRKLQLNGGKQAMVSQGIGYIGYYKASLFPTLSSAENLTIAGLREFAGKWGIKAGLERFAVREYAQQLGIDKADLNQPVQRTDNHTQIKVTLYKWMIAKAKLVVMDNVFSGIDITMHNCICDFVSEAKKRAMGIIYISPHAQEVYDMSDRVYRIKDGWITGQYRNESSR
jgi:ABC-type sugar transport system ATPase subunit